MHRPRMFVAGIGLALAACSSNAVAVLPGPLTPSGRPEQSDRPATVARRTIEAPWTRSLDRLVAGQPVSVTVGLEHRIAYSHRGDRSRLPASNQKLLLSMAALDTFGAGYRFATEAGSETAVGADGVLHDDLWLIGSGDPELDAGDLTRIASRLRAGGLRAVTGSVIGDTDAFDRGWWAPGWIRGLSRFYVRRPTALSVNGNTGAGRPERTAAALLTSALISSGVTVVGSPRAAPAPDRSVQPLARSRSAPLADIVSRQNHDSINFDAEMLTKALGARVADEGSTDSGAEAVEAWAEGEGIRVRAFDGSGLSHRDRVSTADLVTLLLDARDEPWGTTLRRSLPSGGEGTLSSRLAGVPVTAKTGTLFVTPVSALSGYVRSENGRLVAFSILSRGLSKTAAVAIEDAIVRTLAGADLG